MVVEQSDYVLCGKMRDLHPYFSGLCELHFRILGSHTRLIGSSPQTMAQISSLDPIIQVNILLLCHIRLYQVSSALKWSQKVSKVGGIIKFQGWIVKDGFYSDSETCYVAYGCIWEGRGRSYGVSLGIDVLVSLYTMWKGKQSSKHDTVGNRQRCPWKRSDTVGPPYKLPLYLQQQDISIVFLCCHRE